MSRRLKIFISYSHRDAEMKAELDKHLITLKRTGKVDVWHDGMIEPGTEWNSSIVDQLQNADVILLLISVDFNNSQYIWENELSVALERHSSGQARVIPVILRDCDWHDMPYGKLQALPRGGIAIAGSSSPDAVYSQVSKDLTKVIDYLLQSAQNKG